MRLIILLFFSLVLSSCGSSIENEDNVAAVPNNLLPKEQFVDMLTDSYMIEAAIRQGVGKGENAEELSSFFYPKLFKKYHISEQDFKENIRYYSSQPELMQEIQTEVVDRLSLKEQELTNQ